MQNGDMKLEGLRLESAGFEMYMIGFHREKTVS